MKKLNKIIAAMALSGLAAASFAQSSSSGIDDLGQGTLNVSGSFIGSCSAPTINVDLGSIDFHTAKNGATGVYQHPVDISVACTNPNQTWMIFNKVKSFTFDSGLTEGSSENAYVSITESGVAPGTKFYDAPLLTEAQINQDGVLKNIGVRKFTMPGTGTHTVNAMLTFGKSLPSGEVADGGLPTGAVPTGTIDGRGTFAVDIPLEIIY